MVDLFHHPDPPGDGDLVPDRRRLDDRPQLFRTGPDRILDVFLEDRVELVVVHHPLSGKTHNQPAVFRPAQMVDLDEVPQQQPVILLGDPVETVERQHPRRQLARGHLPAGGEGAHRLVVKEAVGEPAGPGRLDKPLLDIELDERNPLD